MYTQILIDISCDPMQISCQQCCHVDWDCDSLGPAVASMVPEILLDIFMSIISVYFGGRANVTIPRNIHLDFGQNQLNKNQIMLIKSLLGWVGGVCKVMFMSIQLRLMFCCSYIGVMPQTHNNIVTKPDFSNFKLDCVDILTWSNITLIPSLFLQFVSATYFQQIVDILFPIRHFLQDVSSEKILN